MSELQETANASKSTVAKVGDYVLATKYRDGDPCDHFCVGFVSGYTENGRYLIVDNDGVNQRANGFRRAERITDDEGQRLVEMIPDISDNDGPSVWWHLNNIRGKDFKENLKEKIHADECSNEDADYYTIVDRIKEEIDSFLTGCLQDPKRLYLGRIEWEQLKQFASSITAYDYESNTGPEYYGLKIFIVSKDNHLFVA